MQMRNFAKDIESLEMEIKTLEKQCSQCSSPDDKVRFMKKIKELNEAKFPLVYQTYSEGEKFSAIRNMLVIHIKMASDGVATSDELYHSFYQKSFSVDPGVDRFFSKLNQEFKTNLQNQNPADWGA